MLRILYKRWKNQPLKKEEQEHLDQWLEASAHNRQLWQDMQQEDWLQNNLDIFNRIDQEAAWQKILSLRTEKPLVKRMMPVWARYAAAAVIVACVAVGALLWQRPVTPPEAIAQVQTPSDIPPGKEGAILTLADGSTINLDDRQQGLIARQGGTRLSLEEGRLVYKPSGSDAVSYNTITTPRGRQFQLVLPDGSRVWLNAGSSLTYPTAFTGKERSVAISGEAYFEVTHNPQKPFRVQINEATRVEVLGTRFNVHSYSNEPSVQTTLMEGSVRVRSGANGAVLKPGQQAQTSAAGQAPGMVNVLQVADPERVIAWKNGLFSFDKTGIRDVMRQIERWYDLDVTYEGTVPEVQLTGEISRNVRLSEILAMLEYKGIPFRIKDKAIIIGRQ